MLKKFINWMRNNRGFSENTISNYSRTLEQFDDFLKKNTMEEVTIDNPEGITHHLINSYIALESAKGKSTKTTNNKLAGIKMFLRFCIIEGLEVINIQTILFARENQLKIDALTKEEATRLLDYFKKVPCYTDKEELIKTRNLLICSFLLYTGLRVNELSNLKIDEVGEDFQVIGKGGKRRYVHLSTETKTIFDLYVMLRKDTSRWLFISHANNCKGKLTNVSIERIIREGGKKAGLEGKVFPHKLRHTFATELVRNKVDLIKVQKLLGHENIRTTENYITVYNNDLRDAVRVINFD